jgi:(S)-2-hydroxy-acid oxidase
MVRMAEKYGFSGIVVTVDAQVIGKRIKDERNKFISPNSIKL